MRQISTLCVCYDISMIIREDRPFGAERRTSLLDPRSEALVLKYLPSPSALIGTAETLAALADTGRLRIISALSVCEMCVSDISALLGINQTTLSHQLRMLRAAGIVKFRKQGKTVFYSISSSDVPELMLLATRLGDGQSDL